MKRTINSLVLILIASVLLTSCDQKKKELKESVEEINKECPISYGDIMTLNNVAFEDNTVEMKFTVNESFFSISALNNHKEETLEILGLSLTKGNRIIDKIIDAEVNLRFVFVGGTSGGKATVEVFSDDLKKSQEKFSNMTDNQKTIVSNVLGVKIKLPTRVDEITTMTGLSITSSAIVYEYEINDREVASDIGSFGAISKLLMKSQMSAQISQSGYLGEGYRLFVQALVDCGQGIKVMYKERNTGSRTSFDISVSELKDILSGKYQKDAPTMKDWADLENAIIDFDNIAEYRDSVAEEDFVDWDSAAEEDLNTE